MTSEDHFLLLPMRCSVYTERRGLLVTCLDFSCNLQSSLSFLYSNNTVFSHFGVTSMVLKDYKTLRHKRRGNKLVTS